MSKSNKYTGFAIALAWPQTFCKQPGSWYDPLALTLGLNKNHYYRVGHAAVVLIDPNTNSCFYFDFGRYHAPFQHGRVRSVDTDHELSMRTVPVISQDKRIILNYREILSELQHNKACHGEGSLQASYCRVDFQAAFAKAMQMQKYGPIPYGPFRINGSNCSRFVNTVIRAGKPAWKFRFSLQYLIPLSPTPMNNVNSLHHQIALPELSQNITFYPLKKLDRSFLKSTLQAPLKHSNIPEDAQWLGGEGAGSWFTLAPEKSQLIVTRYAPDGKVECSGLYKNLTMPADFSNHHLQVTYPSNCKVISLKNQDKVWQFERV